MFIPPAAFDDDRASLIAPKTPLLRESFDKAFPSTPSSFKKRMTRPRFLTARHRRTVSDGSGVYDLTYEGKASEEISAKARCNEVLTKDGEKCTDKKGGRGHQPHKFFQWVRQQEREKLESAKDEEKCFRCDIFATSSSDFNEAAKQCKQLVIEAGGTILEDHECLPGFMQVFSDTYTLPSEFAGPPPLRTSDKTSRGGHIRITPYQKYMYRRSPTPETFEEFLRAGATSKRPAGTLPKLRTSSSRPVSPLTPHAAKSSATNMSPVSPSTLRSLPSYFSNHSMESKAWPRPKDGTMTKRAGDWVKGQADRHKAKLNEELKSSLGMEVVIESVYEGGVESGGLYLDGFNDLAVWMDAGGPVPCETSDGATLWM